MMEDNTETIPSILQCSEIILPAMHKYLSDSPDKKIKLSKSLFAYDPFIVPIESTDSNCLTLEEFLAIADERMTKEIAYKKEILQLKENICEEFNELCSGTQNEEFIDFVTNQSQRVVEAVMDETRIEDKMIVERFLNNMLNGFESEALDLNNFERTAHIIIWKPLLTPFPIGVLEELRKQIEELGEMKNEQPNEKIQKITSHAVSFIKRHMKINDISDMNFDSIEDVQPELKGFVQERKICNLQLHHLWNNKIVFEEFKDKCIENVLIHIGLRDFLNKEINTYYDGVNFNDEIKAEDIKKLLFKINKNIQFLDVKFDCKNMTELLVSLKKLKCLNLKVNYRRKIGNEGAKELSGALGELKNISTLTLNLTNKNIGEEGAKAVSDALRQLKNISTLNLSISNNNIGNEGAGGISTALVELKNISTLTLDLGQNNIGEEGAKALSTALRELKNISTLKMDLQWNSVGDKGATAVSTALTELKNISTLTFHLLSNNIGEEGAKAVSDALRELKNISTLALNLSGNNIGDEETKAVSTALRELKNISTLALNFWRNNIGDEGATAMLNVLRELKKISTLTLNFMYNNIGEEGKSSLQQLRRIYPNGNINYQT